MKRLSILFILSTFLCEGCGKEDLNKDLKAIDPATARPVQSGGPLPDQQKPNNKSNANKGTLSPAAGVQ